MEYANGGSAVRKEVYMICITILILICINFPDLNVGLFILFLIIDVIFACAEIAVVILSIIYQRNIDSDTPTLKLKQFLSLYRADSSRWELCDDYVVYRSKDGYYYAHAKFANYFNYLLYRYMRWHSKIREEKMVALRTQAYFVKRVQSDLNLTREEIDESIKKELKKCDAHI